MVITKCEHVTKQSFCELPLLLRKLPLWGSLFMLVLIQSHCNPSGWSVGGRLLTFSAFRMGAYLSCALIRGWPLIRINTVCQKKSSELNKTWTRGRGLITRDDVVSQRNKFGCAFLSYFWLLISNNSNSIFQDMIALDATTIPAIEQFHPWRGWILFWTEGTKFEKMLLPSVR